MSSANFFDFPKERSLVKTLIVTKYFQAWAKVIMGVQDKNAQQYGNRYEKRIQYLDLFAGPGQYEDGTLSTPLIVLQKAIENPKMRERLVATFNDANATHAEALEQAINDLPGIDQLKYKPSVFCSRHTTLHGRVAAKPQNMFGLAFSRSCRKCCMRQVVTRGKLITFFRIQVPPKGTFSAVVESPHRDSRSRAAHISIP